MSPARQEGNPMIDCQAGAIRGDLDQAKERAKDEADFHPAESDSITECQNYKLHKACPRDCCLLFQKNGAACLDSKSKDNEQLFSHPSHPHMLTLLQHEESEEDE
ncbi:hypothetical protein Q3G72_022094 [Acer saccharum]|nr:hypothetical protein Q3G72_022094 [Acer saccharum]